MTVQQVSQNQPKRFLRGFSVSRHPNHCNHLLLAGVKNRNVIITQRFHAAPHQASPDLFLYTNCYVYPNCTYFTILTRELLGCLLGVSIPVRAIMI